MKWEKPIMDIILIEATQNVFVTLSVDNTDGPVTGGGWNE